MTSKAPIGITPGLTDPTPNSSHGSINQVLDQKTELDMFNETMLQAEHREALPNDRIRVRVEPGSWEYQKLEESGLAAQKLESGDFTRQELVDAGFFFINILGNGEKGIFDGTVETDDGSMLDLSGRTLLTREEVERVYDYQRQNQELFGLHGQDLSEVRKDMLSFLVEATAQPDFESNYDFTDQLEFMDPEQAKVVNAYWKKEITKTKKQNPGLKDYEARLLVEKKFAEEHCADIYEWQAGEVSYLNQKLVRDIPVLSIDQRFGKIASQSSPFLESGFYFSGNLDVNVFTGDDAHPAANEQYRLNTATVHLAGGHPDFPGLSEIGGSVDQQYMPVGYYVNKIFSRDPVERAKLQEEASRVLAHAVGRHRVEVVTEARRRLLELAEANKQMRITRIASVALGKLRRR